MTRFSRCTLPTVFWPYWSAIHLLDMSQPLWKTAEGSGAALLLDTCIEWSVSASENLIAKEKSILDRYMNVGEFLTDTLEPLWKMTAAGSDAPLLLDRGAKLTPVTDGFQLPDFYHWLLFPFSQRPVRDYAQDSCYQCHR